MSYKERMSPAVSNAELSLFQALSARGLTGGMTTQQTIILQATIPDFTWNLKRKCVYLDGEQVHRKRLERDEEVQGQLEKRGWQVLRVTYTAPLSREALVKVADEVAAFLGE